MTHQLKSVSWEIFQRMDARDARQDQLNRILSVIAIAAMITASLGFLVTVYVFFGA